MSEGVCCETSSRGGDAKKRGIYMQMENDPNSKLEFLGGVVRPINRYKSTQESESVFEFISDLFYRENYHSDILAYYLSKEIPKKILLAWLNRESRLELISERYVDGAVKREDCRIDITLFSTDGKSAIIIENKSNGASDQEKQLIRYVDAMEKKGITVEAILYLNKSDLKRPVMIDWTSSEIKNIESKTVFAQLVGPHSFCAEVIDRVMTQSNDIRLTALSMEISSLFNSQVYGGTNMAMLDDFVSELRKGENYENLMKAMDAYQDVPKLLRKTYKEYIEIKKLKFHVGIWRDDCLFVDKIYINHINFGFDIFFFPRQVEFSVIVRNGKEEDIDELKTAMGSAWLFGERLLEQRYKFSIDNILDDEQIKNSIDRILDSFSDFVDV